MDIISWEELVAGSKRVTGKVAVSIGVFDGLHVGHRMLLDKVIHNEDDDADEAESLVITFYPNPSSIYRKDYFLGDLLPLEEKLKEFSKIGFSYALLIDFSSQFGKLSGKDFLQILTSKLNIQKVVVGSNFHCGKNRDTNVYELKRILAEKNISVDIVTPLEDHGAVVSSTKIRHLIKDGVLGQVTLYLKRDYCLYLDRSVPERKGNKYFLDAGAINQVIPGDGIYKIECVDGDISYIAEARVENQTLVWELPDRITVEKIIFRSNLKEGE